MNQRAHRLLATFGTLFLAAIGWPFGEPLACGQSEVDLKVAFIYRICQFVTWTDELEGEPFVIGVVGPPSALERLEAIARDRSVNGRPIVVRRFARLSNLGRADAVFVSYGYRRWTERIVAHYEKRPTLTIGEYEDFAHRGGVIALFFEDDRLALNINHAAALNAGLSLNPRLLTIADHVLGKP